MCVINWEHRLHWALRMSFCCDRVGSLTRSTRKLPRALHENLTNCTAFCLMVYVTSIWCLYLAEVGYLKSEGKRVGFVWSFFVVVLGLGFVGFFVCFRVWFFCEVVQKSYPGALESLRADERLAAWGASLGTCGGGSGAAGRDLPHSQSWVQVFRGAGAGRGPVQLCS